MPFIEAPTTFYLGRRYDPSTRAITDEVVYYDSRDLTTHAIVVGMTGSGKTGLCISLLEEAVLDGIPAIVVDPKGDITNLMLTFPGLSPQDFEPWINPDDAARKGLDARQFAADEAHRWREGLASWGIVPERIQWLRASAQFSIFTPGSDAGLPISILSSLRAPREGFAGNEEFLREQINAVTTALLGLAGRNAQPVQDKEHVLVANIFEWNWQRGIDLTLEQIIVQVQRPPFDKLGVFAIDDYISERARAKLAMDLNSIIAAPSFQSWMTGQPLDIHSLLYTPQGRPRVSIFYTAHLSDAERQFVLTLLLENMLGWMRTQQGTTSLRALLYIDEMFGVFPPYPRNPPTKEPILRLLKQARAFGLGLILATQNPGDLDYKGLTNAGTWFIGRLQAENDKRRVLTGLEALASLNQNLDLKQVDRLISDLAPRTFLMHNVHDPEGPTIVHTRWAMSYLRGPLTRQQIAVLMRDQKAQVASVPAVPAPALAGARGFGVQASQQIDQQYAAYSAPQPARAVGYSAPAGYVPPPPLDLPEMPPTLPEFPSAPAPTASAASAPSILAYTPPPAAPLSVSSAPAAPEPAPVRRGNAPAGFSEIKPALPSTLAEYFLPVGVNAQAAVAEWARRTRLAAAQTQDLRPAYRPMLLAQASVRFQDKKTQLYSTRLYAYLIPDIDRAGVVHWEDHLRPPLDLRALASAPETDEALFGDLPPGLTDARRLTGLKRELTDLLYTTAAIKVPFNPTLDLYGSPDEDYSQFHARAVQMAREQRDAEVEKLTARYSTAVERLRVQLERKAQRLEAEKRELADLKREELFTTGEAVLGLLQGRTSFTLSRMSRVSGFKERSKGQAEMAQLEMRQIETEIDRLQDEFQKALDQINEKWAKAATAVQDYIITPFKKDISIDVFGVGWVPHWYAVINGQPVLLEAASA